MGATAVEMDSGLNTTENQKHHQNLDVISLRIRSPTEMLECGKDLLISPSCKGIILRKWSPSRAFYISPNIFSKLERLDRPGILQLRIYDLVQKLILPEFTFLSQERVLTSLSLSHTFNDAPSTISWI